MEDIASFLTGLAILITALGAVSIALIKAYKNTKKELDSLPKRVKRQATIDTLITDKLEEVKDLLNADRIQIYDFHNGGHWANGRSALKTTCTYEICRSGIKPAQSQLQALPLSCIAKFISTLLKDGKMEVKNLEEIKDTMPATYNLKQATSVKSFYDVVLNNKYNEPIGFLAVQYIKNSYEIKTEKDKEEILKLKFFVEEKLQEMKEGR